MSSLFETIFKSKANLIINDEHAPRDVVAPTAVEDRPHIVAMADASKPALRFVDRDIAKRVTLNDTERPPTPKPELPAYEAELPTVVIPEPEEKVIEIVEKEIESEAEYTSPLAERKLMFMFLKEIADLIDLGKSLDGDESKLKVMYDLSEVDASNFKNFRERAGEIENDFKNFYEGAEDLETDRVKFTKVMESLNEYLADVSAKITFKEKSQSKERDKIKEHIRIKREQISALIAGIGGVKNFSEIKGYIKGAERVSGIAKSMSKKEGVRESTVADVNTHVVNAVENDPHGMQLMMLGSNANQMIISILQRIFVPEQNTKTN